MKNIKDLKIITVEGLTVKNLQRFPSMEWGEEGGLEAEIYFKGKHAATVYNSGDGGCANVTLIDDSIEFKTACYNFLVRVDKSYGPDSQYNWLKTKTPSKMNDDDYEAVVTNIEERYDDVKAIAKCFKNGYKAVAILKSDFQTQYLQYRVNDITESEVQNYLQTNKQLAKYHLCSIIIDTQVSSLNQY